MTASLVLPLAFEASAQNRDTTTPSTTQRGAYSDKDKDKNRAVWHRSADMVETKKLIGAKVKGADGKDVGEIEQLVVNQMDGKVTHAIIGKGGVAGIGETKVVVPWSEVKTRWDRDKLVASVDSMALDRAPKHEARESDRAPAASPSTEPRSSR